MTTDNRSLRELPKAHLHLHFTGSMRHATLLELAERDGIRLPDQLVSQWPPELSAADEKGWFRFQRLYDVARSVLRTEGDVRRLVLEAAEDDVHDGGGWLEIQVDPSGYAARFGGVTAFTDLVLDAVRSASEQTGLGMAVVIAANRTRHPLDARTLARLAASTPAAGSSASACPTTSAAARQPTSRARSGSPSGPGCGWCRTRASCAAPSTSPPASTRCTPSGWATGSDPPRTPGCSSGSSRSGVALEICPVSNVALGVYSDLSSVPLPTLLEAGATIALGADDPLLFGSRLLGQYAAMRAAHDLSDEQLAELARMSVRASSAPDDVRKRLLVGIEEWLLPSSAA